MAKEWGGVGFVRVPGKGTSRGQGWHRAGILDLPGSLMGVFPRPGGRGGLRAWSAVRVQVQRLVPVFRGPPVPPSQREALAGGWPHWLEWRGPCGVEDCAASC